MSLASVILLLGEVLEVCDLLLAGVVLPLGPAVQGLDLLLPGVVLGVELAVQLGNVRDAVLVVLLLPLLQRFDLVFPENILSVQTEWIHLMINCNSAKYSQVNLCNSSKDSA